MFVARLVASGVIAAVVSSGISVAGARTLSAGDCGCFSSSAERSGPVATLTATSGRVVVSGATAPRIGSAGQKLAVGERVAAGANSSANVSLGSCKLAIQSDQELVIQRVDGGICAVLPGAVSGKVTSLPSAPLVIGGAALLAGGVALAISSGDDSPASP